MKKRKFPLFLVLGICLILLSISMVLVFQIRMHLGAQHSQTILSSIEQILPERTAGIPGSYLSSAMPVLEIEDADYVAMLEVPSFDNSLIIGGTDAPRQFGFCDKIEHGAQIIITDMTGAQFTYTVSKVDRAKRAETQWLMDSDYELTLFCHDVYSMEYIAVRCNLSSN